MSGITSDAIYDALRLRYCAPQYALFFEVANGTGSNIRRYCDALAMSLFPSRGLGMHGFEVKVSRSDWQRELALPDKVEEGIYRFCDHWWVTAVPGVVREGELPETWGLLELREGKLRQMKAAPKLQPMPMDRSFIAALLRRADEGMTARVRNLANAETAVIRAKLDALTTDNDAAIEAAVEERTKRHRDLVANVRKFEEFSGISILGYGYEAEKGRLIRAMNAAGLASTYGGLHGLASQLANTAQKIRDELAEFDKLAPPAAKDEAA